MNLAALKLLLESDARYAAATAEGANGALLALLNAPNAGAPKRWRPIPCDDFLAAIAGESLTPAQEDRIRTYTQQRTHVPVHLKGVRDWIQAQGWASSTILALRALAENPAPFCVSVLADDEDGVNLADVRRVAAQLAAHPKATSEAQARTATADRLARLEAYAQADAAWAALGKPWQDHPVLQATNAINAETKANV